MSSAFTTMFGDAPQVKLLDFLADNLEFDYTITQLAESAEVSRPTVYALVERLTGEGLVVHTRTVGRSRFYRINRENPVIRSLLRVDYRRAVEAAYAAWRRSGARPVRTRRAGRRVSAATPR